MLGKNLLLLALTGGCFAVSERDAHGQTFQELHALMCQWDDTTGWDCTAEGAGPQCALVQGRDGDFYGTTTGGGRWGCGTVFKISSQGVFTTLGHFDGTNGSFPYGALLQARDGNFYGSTLAAGGSGTINRITPNGDITDISAGRFGAAWQACGDFVQGPDGKIYGASQESVVIGYHGTIFRFTMDGAFELLRLFSSSEDGLYPSGGLLFASDGYFYGVTSFGGANDNGTVYRISTNGDFATIASFRGGYQDASWPNGKLVEAPDGSLYGLAQDSSHVGAVFRVTKDGTLTTVAAGMAGVNQSPIGSLVLARDGNFYGCTYEGGDWVLTRGSVFRMTPQGLVTTLFPFTMYWPPYPGAYPYAGLIQGTDGNLYGTTWQGGAGAAGNIFRINMPGPELFPTVTGGGLVLSWRTNFTGYFLQSTDDPIRGKWSDCRQIPGLLGAHYFVTNTIAGPARFFRLNRNTEWLPPGARSR